MKYRFSIEFSLDSAIIQLHNLNEDETYSIMIGPKKSATFFTSLLLDSIEHRSDTIFSIKGDFTRRNLGPAVCHAALSTERSLINVILLRQGSPGILRFIHSNSQHGSQRR